MLGHNLTVSPSDDGKTVANDTLDHNMRPCQKWYANIILLQLEGPRALGRTVAVTSRTPVAQGEHTATFTVVQSNNTVTLAIPRQRNRALRK
jgi:hypothetical protein